MYEPTLSTTPSENNYILFIFMCLFIKIITIIFVISLIKFPDFSKYILTLLISHLTGGGPGDTVRGADGGTPRPATLPPRDRPQTPVGGAALEGARREEEPHQRRPGGEDRPAGGGGGQPQTHCVGAQGRERPPGIQASGDGRGPDQSELDNI